MASSKDELLSLCVSELPEKELKLNDGKTVRVRALKGSDAARVVSLANMDERMAYAIPKGLVEPDLSSRDIRKLIDYAPATAIEILTEILELSGALDDVERREDAVAEKN